MRKASTLIRRTNSLDILKFQLLSNNLLLPLDSLQAVYKTTLSTSPQLPDPYNSHASSQGYFKTGAISRSISETLKLDRNHSKPLEHLYFLSSHLSN